MLKSKPLNPEIADKSEWFHQGTMIWAYAADWRNYDEYYSGAEDLTDQQWAVVEAGWNWIESKHLDDAQAQYEALHIIK